MKENKYRRPIPARATRNGGMDVYDVLTAFGVTCPALAHAVKKILCPGQRGAKDKLQDLKEAAWSLAESIQFAEDAAGTSALHEPRPDDGSKALAAMFLQDAAAEYQAANPPKYPKCPKCPECNGTGHQPSLSPGGFVLCRDCSGTGTYAPHEPADGTVMGRLWNTAFGSGNPLDAECPHCTGCGIVQDEPCQACDGLGRRS